MRLKVEGRGRRMLMMGEHRMCYLVSWHSELIHNNYYLWYQIFYFLCELPNLKNNQELKTAKDSL